MSAALPGSSPTLALHRTATLLLLALTGCAGLLEQVGQDLGRGAFKAAEQEGPKAVEALVQAAGDGLRRDVLNAQTEQQLAQAVGAAGESARAEVAKLRDELLSARTEEELRRTLEALLAVAEARAERTARGVVAQAGRGLYEDVLSRQNEQRLNAVLTSMAETLRHQSVRMRDDMLSEDADRKVRILVAAAMDEVVLASERIRQKAHDELSFAQRNATVSLLLATGLGALVAFFIWRQKEKNRILLNLLLSQLHNASSGRGHELLGRVDEQAQQLGVQQLLRTLLRRQGLLADDKDSASEPGPSA